MICPNVNVMDKTILISLPIEEFQNLIIDCVNSCLLNTKVEQTSKEDSDGLLSVKEAADFLGLTVPTIYTKSSRGELPVMKRSKRLYFSKNDLMEYVKAGRRKSNDEIAKITKEYQENRP